MHLPWVPEFARDYVACLGRPYQRHDLVAIGRGQWAWEQWYARQNPPVLLCDTDWTVLHIWEHYRYGPPPDEAWQWQRGYSNAAVADMYFLCAPDFPWQPDPLRENPDEREALFEWYEQLLRTHAAAYTVLAGPFEQRLTIAYREVERLLRMCADA